MAVRTTWMRPQGESRQILMEFSDDIYYHLLYNMAFHIGTYHEVHNNLEHRNLHIANNLTDKILIMVSGKCAP